MRDNAAKFGVTLDDKAAMEAAMTLGGRAGPSSTRAIPAELQPAMQAVQQLYPGRNFHEVANDYAQIDQRLPA